MNNSNSKPASERWEEELKRNRDPRVRLLDQAAKEAGIDLGAMMRESEAKPEQKQREQ